MLREGIVLMTNIYLWGASGLSTLWLLIHLFVGGREIARPLLQAARIKPIVRNTQYLCWHFTTVAIACMAGFYAQAVLSGEEAFAIAGTALAIGFFLIGVGLVTAMRANHLTLPQGWLFLPVALLGLAAIAS